MEIIEKEEFAELIAPKTSPCITIYLPVHQSGVEVNEKQDLIVFKNLLFEAENTLVANGLKPHLAQELLAPASSLLEDEKFWHQLLSGLAVFIAPDFFKILNLPFQVNAEIHINSGFNVAQFVRVVTDRPYYYLLVISKNSADIYKGDEYGMELLTIDGMPQGLNDVVHLDEKSERKLFRIGGTAPGSAVNAHGHGSGLADEKEYIKQYLKAVDHVLQTELLANETAPLLLAGVEYIVGIYRQVSHYKHLLPMALTGNHEHADVKMLVSKALEAVGPFLNTKSKSALQNYYNQLATPLTSSMPNKVIPAGYYKQISDLFVERGAHLWGRFDETANSLTLHENREPGDECLINKTILNTLQNGGDVYILEKDRMPKEAIVAASLRF